MSSIMKKNYKLRMHNIVAVNVSWVIKQAANIIYSFLDARLTNKIKIFTDNGNQYLDSLIGKDQLEQKFGGKLPNKTGEFFPPRFNPV